MNRFLILFLMLALNVNAATVRNYMVDPFTGEVDTNALVIRKISTNILSNGGVVGVGVPTRTTSSPWTNTLSVGFYSVSNTYLRSAYVINVPDTADFYDATNILHSGFNTYVTRSVTSNEVVSALGFVPGEGGTSGALTNADSRSVFVSSLETTNSITASNIVAPIIRFKTNGTATSIQMVFDPVGESLSVLGEASSVPLRINWRDTAASGIVSPLYTGSGAGVTNIPFAGLSAAAIGDITNAATTVATQATNDLWTVAVEPALDWLTNNAGGGITLGDATNAAITVATQATNTLAAPALIGTLPDAAFPTTLPQRSGVNLTNVTALRSWSGSVMTNGTVPSAQNIARMPVPPRIWGSWYDFVSLEETTNYVTAQYFIDQAFWMKTNGMKEAGWEDIFIVEGWNAGLDEDGYFIVNSNMFPDGIEVVIDAIKTNGFRPSIYTSSISNNAETCLGYAGSSYSNIVKHAAQFAAWGFDGVFVDACGGYDSGGTLKQRYAERVRLWNEAIGLSGRKMWLYVTPPQYSGEYTSDAATYGQVNIGHWGPGDGGFPWDFAPTANTRILSEYFHTNQQAAGRFTMPGTYLYYAVNNYSIAQTDNRAHKLVNSLNAIVAGAYITTSTGQRRGYPIDPVTYHPGTWYQTYLGYQTNREIAAVHQDPAVIAGSRVWANDFAEIWVRPLGSYTSKSNAVLVVNHSSTNADITIPSRLLKNYGGEAMTWRELYNLTNAVDPVIGDYTVTVAPSNNNLYVTAPYVTATRGDWEAYSFRQATVTGTGATVPTAASYGPAPFYNVDGVSQTGGGNVFYFYFPAPTWATRATMALKFYSAGGAVAWTNSPGYEYYRDAGRVSRTTANDAGLVYSDVLTTSGEAKWFTNTWNMVATNAPKAIVLNVNGGTNTSARYIIGPAYIKFE